MKSTKDRDIELLASAWALRTSLEQLTTNKERGPFLCRAITAQPALHRVLVAVYDRNRDYHTTSALAGRVPQQRPEGYERRTTLQMLKELSDRDIEPAEASKEWAIHLKGLSEQMRDVANSILDRDWPELEFDFLNKVFTRLELPTLDPPTVGIGTPRVRKGLRFQLYGSEDDYIRGKLYHNDFPVGDFIFIKAYAINAIEEMRRCGLLVTRLGPTSKPKDD
jgi:hypothetical protein